MAENDSDRLSAPLTGSKEVDETDSVDVSKAARCERLSVEGHAICDDGSAVRKAHGYAYVCWSRDTTTISIHDPVEFGPTSTDWANETNNNRPAENTCVMNFRGE